MFREVPRQLRRIILRDEEEDPHGMEVGVWRLALRQFYRRDAQGPHVCLGIVRCTQECYCDPADTASISATWLLDDLRRHPEGGADEGVPLAGGVGQLPRHAEVRQLHVAHVAQQHVGGLQQQLVVVHMFFVLQDPPLCLGVASSQCVSSPDPSEPL